MGCYCVQPFCSVMVTDSAVALGLLWLTTDSTVTAPVAVTY